MNFDISCETFLRDRSSFIPVDVRSPSEYKESSIPGAINVPLFSDMERSEIGTLYKQVGTEDAKWRAMELVSPKIPELLSTIRNLETSSKKPLVYCWRGGMRSESITLFSSMAGMKVNRLQGGYRAFREQIVEDIPKLIPEQLIVLYGMTGTGKTDILHRLQEKGYPILDLEGLANHRGSLFGSFYGQAPHNQKTFDALLYDALTKQSGLYVVVEAESKRIGYASQPEELMKKKENGIHIQIVASMETRVERIYKEYVENFGPKGKFEEEVELILTKILKRVKIPTVKANIVSAWKKRDFHEIISLLIVHYYDPMYKNKNNDYIQNRLTIHSDHIEEAVEQITMYLKGQGFNKKEQKIIKSL